jgi:Na+-transporting methylmalonyl-CoA/oxaloacetate decarboxylase gamma subunit
MSVVNKDRPLRAIRELGFCLLAGAIGGGAVWIGQGRSLHIKPSEISYSDLISILLTAVAVLVAIFGVVMAVLAIFGYQHFKTVVEKTSKASAEEIASKTAKNIADEKLNSDEVKQLIVMAVATRIADAEKDGTLAAWAIEQRKQQAALNEVDEDHGGGDER